MATIHKLNENHKIHFSVDVKMLDMARRPQWMPEDDLLLKNAVEAGASLHALAKGAVRFSHRFTIQEIENRWQSLLYDPTISANASASMVEFELSSSKRPSNSKASADLTGKRKMESICRQYYSMRKRIHGENFNSTGKHFLGNEENLLCDGELYGGKGTFRNHIPNQILFPEEVPSCFGLDSSKAFPENKFFNDKDLKENISSAFGERQPYGSPVSEGGNSFHSLSEATEDISARVMPMNGNLLDKDLAKEETVPLSYNNDNSKKIESCYDELNSGIRISEDEFLDISDALLNFVNEDSVLFLEDGRDTTTVKPHGDDFDSNLLASQSDGCDNSVPCANEHSVPCLNMPSSTVLPNIDSLEYRDGALCCLLNSEDPEIPCNDQLEVVCHLHSSLDQIESERASLVKNNEISQFGGDKGFSEISPSNLLVDFRVPSQFPNMTSKDGGLEKEIVKVDLKEKDTPASIGKDLTLHEGSSSINEVSADSIEAASSSDQVEFQSDEDVPSFSDIEAMILEMDLSPYDDSYLSSGVLKYQSEDAKRRITRLEQCACSSMQRSIASQNALAILYGCHQKHYIKKPEVVLGRATEEVDVDIDLGREGPSNKISRRQAIIKMEGDGSFSLKNLGKSPILVNGKEIITGQILSLTPSCLIEIREIRFLFEVNHKAARRYWGNMGKGQKNHCYDWTP